MNRDQLTDIAGLLGAALVAAGAGMIYLPAGVIAAGIELVAGAILFGIARNAE